MQNVFSLYLEIILLSFINQKTTNLKPKIKHAVYTL